MKFEKKLKNSIEKSGEELREKNNAFYERMASLYPEPSPTPIVRRSIWRTPRFITSAVACLVFVLTFAIMLPIGINRYNKQDINKSQVIDNNSSVNELAVTEFKVTLKEYGLRQVGEGFGIFTFGEKSIGFDKYAINQNTELKGENGESVVGSYVMGNGGGDWFQVLLITDSSYAYKSKLASNYQTATIEGITFDYSLSAKESGLSYYYAESQIGDKRLVVEYMTTVEDSESALVEFLKNIII